MALTKVPSELSSTPSIVDGGNSTAITITSDENVLAGKTATDYNTAGIEIDGANNRLFVTRAGTPVLINRKSSDGQLVSFYRDTTEVGSIGSEGGDALYIQSGTTSGAGLHMHPTGGNINPARNGAKVDNAIDLGRSSHRFRDAHISRYVIAHQGAFLGGNSSANYLNSYEEGVWTPTDESGAGLSFTVSHNRYTKIGRVVHAHVHLTYPTTSNTSLAKIGIPFPCSGDSDASSTGGAVTEQNISTSKSYTASVNYSASLVIREFGNTSLANNELSGKNIRFTVTYFTT